METIGSEDEDFERSEERASLEPALERLPDREREILRMRFEEGLTQTQIAEQGRGLPDARIAADPKVARAHAGRADLKPRLTPDQHGPLRPRRKEV